MWGSTGVGRTLSWENLVFPRNCHASRAWQVIGYFLQFYFLICEVIQVPDVDLAECPCGMFLSVRYSGPGWGWGCNGTPDRHLYDRFTVTKPFSYFGPKCFAGGNLGCHGTTYRRSRKAFRVLEQGTCGGSRRFSGERSVLGNERRREE